MNSRLAFVISVLVQPALMPTVTFTFLLTSNDAVVALQSESVWKLLAYVFVATYLLPILGVVLLKQLGIIESILMEKKSERFYPMLVVSVFYTAVAYLFTSKIPNEAAILSILMCSLALSLLVTTFITKFYKISVHGVGVGGFFGVVFAISSFNGSTTNLLWLVSAILLSGLTLSSRLALNAHTPNQALWGFVLGSGINYGILMWWLT